MSTEEPRRAETHAEGSRPDPEGGTGPSVHGAPGGDAPTNPIPDEEPAEEETITWVSVEEGSPAGAAPAPPTVMLGQTSTRRPRRRPLLVVGTAAAAAALVAAATSYAVVKLTGQSGAQSVRAPIVIRQVQAQPAALGGQNGIDIPAILAKVEPAVVDITATGVTQNGFGTSQFEDAGTGMIISSNGLVLTNNHVISGATSIRVTLYGQTSSRVARVVGTDPAHDVALLQIVGASGLPTVTFGNSAALQVGDPVVAIGNALALQGTPTVTQGIVSALHRSITASANGYTENLADMIQTDAPISSGNSGGPLVDAQGDVVGMNTAVIDSTGQTAAQNLGFAESIDSVLPIVKAIEQNPSTYSTQAGQSAPVGSGAFLGVAIRTLTPALDSQVGFPSSQQGALVEYVYPGSAAAAAGIQPGDAITAVNGQSIASAGQLASIIHADTPGQTISVTLLTPTGVQTVSATLTPAPTT